MPAQSPALLPTVMDAPLSRQACTLLLLLSLLPAPRRVLDLAQLTDIPALELDDTLWELFQRGLVQPSDGLLRWIASPGHARHLPACLHTLRTSAERNSLESVLILLHEGKNLNACMLLEPQLDVLIRRSHIGGASLCMEILIGQLFLWPNAPDSPKDLRIYIDLVVAIQSKSLYFGLRTQKAYTLTDKALEAARALDDRRAEAVLTLLSASLENFSGEFRPDSLRASIAKGFAAVDALGGSDTLVQAGNFIFTLHYAQGEFAKAVEAFEQTLWAPRSGQVPYFREMYPLYICPAALYLGQYPYAIGMAEHSLRLAERAKYHHNIHWWHVLLGIIFLYLRQQDKALPHLAAVMDCLDAEADPKLALWAERGLAYYHYLEGRTATSYGIFRRCMELRSRLGYSRFSYTAPWILELPAAYEEAGFPPLPGFALEDELAYAQSSGHTPLRGLALRIIARRMERAGAPFKKVLSQYEQSLALFHQTGDAIEHAKAQLELAAFLQRHGEHARARIMQEQGEDCLRMLQSGEQALRRQPAAVDTAIARWEGCITPHRPSKAVVAYEAVLDAQTVPLPHRQSIQRIIYLAQRELGAERAALFHRNAAGGHAFIDGANCDEAVYDTPTMRMFIEDTFARFDATDRQDLYTLHDGVLSLALRLESPQGPHWGLLLESRHVAGDFACLTRRDCARLVDLLTRRLLAADTLRHTAPEMKMSPHIAPATPHRTPEENPYGESPGLRLVTEQARHIAPTDVPILLQGETGVGKEVLARRIHAYSGRSGPFVAVHPASTPETLFESEFFGHEKGAFTGAEKQKPGLFEMADKGTLFVDEVGEISMLMQVKLLRVLQDKTFLRVGGVRLIASDFRLITATNRNLSQEVTNGNFREDLYYRISVMPLNVPPLRARPQDIGNLARFFTESFARRYGRTIAPLTADALAELEAYSWPGNVRELKNVVERAVLLHKEGPLRFHLHTDARADMQEAPTLRVHSLHHDTPTLETLERRYIEYIIRQSKGKVNGPQGAAALLGMKRSTLYAKIRQFGLADLLSR